MKSTTLTLTTLFLTASLFAQPIFFNGSVITAGYFIVKISFEKANDNTTYSAYTANHNKNTDTTPLLEGRGVKDRYSTSNSQKQKL